MLDPISDMLTRIRNAQMANHSEVVIPASRLKLSIARILEKKNFIERVEAVRMKGHEALRVVLRYETVSRTKRKPAISGIDRMSRQGQRIYVGKALIRPVKSGYGITILSTSKGVMTGDEARRIGVGGEMICKVW